MIKEQNDIFSLNDLIARGYPIAIYRSPGEKLLNIITQNDATIFTTKDIEELNGKEGFVIAPFQSSNNNPICLIRSDRNWTISLDDLCCDSDRRPSEPEGELCSDDYKKRFEIFIKALKVMEWNWLWFYSNLFTLTCIENCIRLPPDWHV